MSNILYCIVAHDIKIIEYCEKTEKYKPLPNYKYILVGNQDKDYSNEYIIQADLLPDNIEKFNNYLAYTAWWAVGKNLMGDIHEDYVFFLEYDSDIVNIDKLSLMENYITSSEIEVFGTDSLPTTTCFVNDDNFMVKLLGYKDSGFWMVTNNICFSKNALIQFINDPILLEVFNILGNGVGTGHELERYTTLYCASRGLTFGIIEPKCFEHIAMDSHNTQGRFHIYETFKNNL